MSDCFALLDDHQSSPAQSRSRLYTGHLRTLACTDAAGMPALLAEMQAALAAGQHAVAIWTYELGAALQGLAYRDPGVPLARVMLFSQCRSLDADAVMQWLDVQSPAADDDMAGIAGLRASVDEAAFTAAIDRIRAYIVAGDTYQVNYTYRLHFDAYGDPLRLYRQLRARQPVPYGALIRLDDGGMILSFSPELFVRHEDGLLTARPMKGTAPAATAQSPDADALNAQRASALAADEKNRAENLMIVDLLRNDLGRVAASGSVHVPELFDVRRFGQVLQMTSTIQARLHARAVLPDIVQALYPCGSITGAPKRRTMEIIHELETTPRGVYTGAIGWFDAPRDGGHAVGNFCLSVPIRTLVLQAPPGHATDGLRRGELGIGAGIVHDSEAASEYAECKLKARFLTGLGHDFSLFETMLVRDGDYPHLERHLHRLAASAARFDFPFDEAAVRAALAARLPALGQGAGRVRLALDGQGRIALQHAPLGPLAETVNVFLAARRTDSGDLFLQHKSTRRAVYDAAWRDAEARGGFDTLFFNERDELTEGGRSNVFVKLDGQWLTPALACGVLPGVMRAVLLEDAQWQAREAVITRVQLLRAEEIVVCNALRGAVWATLVVRHDPLHDAGS